MLSYQHIYHAGNAADVHKHLWLLAVLGYLQKKDKAFFWLDTHGGRGLYDLCSAEALKLQEYQDGYLKFCRVFSCEADCPALFSSYRDAVAYYNEGRDMLSFYPGSALLAARMLRAQDVLHVCELHKQEAGHLEAALQSYPKAHVRQQDGYQALKALIPPVPRRGGVLLDPSYEVKTEYDAVLRHVQAAYQKWPQGVYMVWYPLLSAGRHEQMVAGFRAMAEQGAEVLVDEWLFYDPARCPSGRGMYGSGMVIVNAPYTTEEQVSGIKNALSL